MCIIASTVYMYDATMREYDQVHYPSLCCLPPHTTHLTPLAAPLTCTDHSCILPVGTVMHSKTTMGTLSEAGFTATAVHIVIPNWTTSSSITSIRNCSHSSAIAQLTTDHFCILPAPVISAHRTPVSIVVDLYTSCMWTRLSHQSYFSFT